MNTRDDNLTQRVKKYCREQLGARLVGVASIDRFEGAPKGHRPCDFLPSARAVVVLGVPIVRGLMGWGNFMQGSEVVPEDAPRSDNPNDGTWKALRCLQNHVERRCAYESINDDLQRMSMHASWFLEEAGHVALYLPTTFGGTHSWSREWGIPVKAFGPFSHRHAAVAAGLGAFGLSNLFMARGYGSRVRLASVITAAPLVPDPLCEPDICLSKCRLCIENCPAKALGDPIEFVVAGTKQVMARIDHDRCRQYYNQGIRRCNGECMSACPVSLTNPQPTSNVSPPCA